MTMKDTLCLKFLRIFDMVNCLVFGRSRSHIMSSL